MLVSHELTRRDFVTAAGALAGAAFLPAAATVRRPPAEGTVVLFQGDSITDGGRNRAASEPNQPGALGTSYPLLVAAAALAAHPDRALRFYNRGVSGNKVPDLEQRWAGDTLELKPDVLSILVGVNDFWHRSEEHTSELQSLTNLVCRLLLEKQKGEQRHL